MKRARAAIAIAFLCSVAAGSSIKYGKPSDLHGAKTFYVDAGSDVEERNDLVKRIESKTQLTVHDDAETADVVIVWTSHSEKCAKASVIRVIEGSDPRLVWSWSDCAGGYVGPEFLFVRKLAKVIEDNR